MTQVRTFLSDKSLTLALSVVLLIFYPMEILTIAKYGMSTFEFWFLFTPGLIPTPAWVLSLFVHVTPHHLIVNIVGLLVYGLVLEHFINRKLYLGVYVSTGLLAGLIHTNLAQSTGAGASGAIMGIVGFYSVIYLLLYRPRDWNDPVENVRYVLALLGPFVVAGQYVVDFYINSGSGGIAHLTGALIGGTLGFLYAMSRREGSISRTIESTRESPFRTALLILVLAETALIVHFLNTTPEDATTSTSVQAGATIILVLITVWYADHTRRNADLFRRELELETQRNHAETLQIRTKKWLDNIPEVSETDIRLFTDVNKDDSFAIPQTLQDDPYFEDLLENHATDLEHHIDAIESKYTEFQEIREDFIECLDISVMFPDTRKIVVLEENYGTWIFERILLLERTDNDKDDLQFAVENAFEDESYEEDNVIYLVGDSVQERQKPIIVYHYQRSTASSRRDSYWNRVWAGIPQHHIRNIEACPNYDEAVQAAELLDDLEGEINQLKKDLIEYNEVPRFDGECDLILDID